MVALKPLPVRDPASLVRLERRSPEIHAREMPYPAVQFYEQHAKSLSAVMGVMGIPPMTVGESSEALPASFATANYFSELGTQPLLGRVFDPARESDPTAPPVAVLSYGAWQRSFASDVTVVGRTIQLNERAVTVIGVLPHDFATLGGQGPDIWLPIAQQPYFYQGSKVLTDGSAGTVRMWARLAPGVTAKAAEAELLSLTNELRKEHPKDVWENEVILSDPGGHLQVMEPEMYQVAAMIAALTLLILTVTCANLGGLLLARGITREHEIGIRVAIGASRTRIFRQLFTESLLLAALGSSVAVALSVIVMRVTLISVKAPGWVSAVPDWRVLLFGVGIAFLAAAIFGLAPALQIARQRQRRPIARQVLIGAQIAASCILLIVASLLVRAMQHMIYSSPGFGYQQTFSIDPQLGRHGYTASRAQTYLDEMQTRLRSMPGVLAVSLVQMPPMGHKVSRMDDEVNGKNLEIFPNQIGPGFFQAMNIPVILGRDLHPHEKSALVVSESLAQRLWPGENPIGKYYPTDSKPGQQRDMVVGVVGNARFNALQDNDATEAYWAAKPEDMQNMTLVVKTTGAAGSFIAVARSVAQVLDPKVLPETRSMKVLFEQNVSQVERIATLVSMVGLVALLIAAVGIIGLVSYAVTQRTKEIAIRLALGARRLQVMKAVLGQFASPVVLGLVVGVASAAAASKLLRQVLYGVCNLDPFSYAAAILVLIGIIALATLLPIRRALHLELAKILHYQ